MRMVTHHPPGKQAAHVLKVAAITWLWAVILTGTTHAESCRKCHPAFTRTDTAAQSHPLKMLSYHSIDDFQCTDCHMAVTFSRPALPYKTCPVHKGYFLKKVYVQAACGKCHESTFGLSGAEMVHKGENLFHTRGCAACHSPEPTDTKFAPPLNGISGKLKDKRWLPAWLQGPRLIRPETMMPDFGISSDKACRIASFLLSLTDPHHYKNPDLSRASAERGAHYFVYRGCRACHKTAPRGSGPLRRIPSLNDAGTKFRPGWVLMELEDPRAYNPDARIPLVDATMDEVLDIMAYLNTLTLDPEKLPPLCNGADTQYAENGRAFVKQAGCFACHGIDGFDQMPPPAGGIRPQLKKSASPRPWEYLTHAITRSPHNESSSFRHMPSFYLTEDEVRALVTYFMKAPLFPDGDLFIAQSNAQRVGHEGNRLINDYGCGLCHRIDPGGSPYINSVIERRRLLPPSLIGEGEKVQPQWLVRYLDRPSPMRIWMTMVMPYFYFSEQENHALVRYFRLASGFDPETIADYRLPFDIRHMDSKEKALGLYRFQHDHCAQCHPAGLDQALPENVSVDDLAIDLLMTKDRLRYEWVLNFLRNPKQFAGNDTRMPFIYFSPEGFPRVPDADRWLQRVARALYLMEALPEPDEKANIRDVIDVKTFWENY